MANSFYNVFLKAIAAVAIMSFVAITYVNCYETDPVQYVFRNDSLIGPIAPAEYLASVETLKPDNYIVTAYLAIDTYEKRFHGITYTGAPAEAYRTAAVDPEVIPLGSWLYIEGLGWWKAEDTGNLVKGHHVDICVSSRDEAKDWGRRRLKVWCISPEQMAAKAAVVQKAILAAADNTIS